MPITTTITRKRRNAVRARLGVAGHLSTTLRWGNPVKCLPQMFEPSDVGNDRGNNVCQGRSSGRDREIAPALYCV